MIKPVFCAKCHTFICNIIVYEDGTVQIYQHGQSVGAKVKNMKTVDKNGKEHKGFPFSCKKGHCVYLDF